MEGVDSVMFVDINFEEFMKERVRKIFLREHEEEMKRQGISDCQSPEFPEVIDDMISSICGDLRESNQKG